MIALSKMVGGEVTVSERLTYKSREKIPVRLVEASKRPVPVTVWNTTARCNLRCVHCYAEAGSAKKGELTHEEAVAFIDDLADMKVPVLLLSGGEPLMREDIFELISYAKSKGLHVSLSTNGTLISEEVAEKLAKAGVDYVGVSLDGMPETNDRFRGLKGAFERAFEGLVNAKEAGILTGIRFTVTKYNLKDVPEVVNLLVENEIPRFCLYHLVPSGRADFSIDIAFAERRELMEWLFEKALELRDAREVTEILTVDNPADGVFFYLKLRELDESLAEDALQFLRYRGGDSSGYRIADVDMFGNVHPNQFWFDYTVGNIRERKFSEIWLNPTDELLIKLREKEKHIRGYRCGRCRFKSVCGGFRLRAMRNGDLWGDDPSCYLYEDEIGIA
ncbi:putative Fe-S oxidoreductase [Geoglobus ahangari]|uniref:Putative Fe-S oxidoreductase n=1 Tax=Geoglobus ahangari TaxID=113653 RepID=A0A0F7IG60_9EURY|nr:radical SAM protein [Geoglobus ahangari]AKG92527.1 putative Fe-S oxidoreductase [Geoglobus ahangari]